MITAVHIEDEPRNVELLASLINSHFKETIVMKGSAGNVMDAYQTIKKINPQLVFLDIELNKGNAFELLNKLKESVGINFEVIFMTAYNEYAVKAFRLNALDYLLKPFSVDELGDAITRATNKIKAASDNETGHLSVILNQLQHNIISRKKMGIAVAGGIEFVRIEEIIKIEAKGSCSTVYLENEIKITCTRGLSELVENLPENIFLRVHNQWVINAQHLTKYYKGRNGYLQMDDGTQVPVSIRKKGSVLDTF